MDAKPTSIGLLGHPMRLAILRFLGTHGTASPKMISKELGTPVENVAYHVREMAKMRIIRIDRRRAVRGAIEHFYRLNPTRARKMVDELRALAAEIEVTYKN